MQAQRKRLPIEDQAEVKPSDPPPPPPPPPAPTIKVKKKVVKQEDLPPGVQHFNIGDKKTLNAKKIAERIRAIRSGHRRMGVVQGRVIKKPSGTAVLGKVLSKVTDWSDI